jgi:hypothetical protein
MLPNEFPIDWFWPTNVRLLVMVRLLAAMFVVNRLLTPVVDEALDDEVLVCRRAPSQYCPGVKLVPNMNSMNLLPVTIVALGHVPAKLIEPLVELLHVVETEEVVEPVHES